MSIYLQEPDFLAHIFNACSNDQIAEFTPVKRGFRINGHSTTIRLETAFWNTLEAMAKDLNCSLPELIERTQQGCLVANDKNLASCLRVICLKYINIYFLTSQIRRIYI